MEKDIYLQLEEKILEIEEEMKKIGTWEIQAPAPEAYENMGAFGGRTMAFEQWIRYVFIPRVREVIKDRAPLPPSSSVGSYAVREFDGRPETDRLIHILIEFDRLIPRQY